MELNSYCTGMLDMRQQKVLGGFYGFSKCHKWPTGKTKKPTSWHLMLITNIQANRVVIVSSVITRILNPCKYWTVMTQTFINMFSKSVLGLFVASFIVHLLFTLLFFCSTPFVRLFSVRSFDYSVYFSVLILELYSRYFDPTNPYQ